MKKGEEMEHNKSDNWVPIILDIHGRKILLSQTFWNIETNGWIIRAFLKLKQLFCARFARFFSVVRTFRREHTLCQSCFFFLSHSFTLFPLITSKTFLFSGVNWVSFKLSYHLKSLIWSREESFLIYATAVVWAFAECCLCFTIIPISCWNLRQDVWSLPALCSSCSRA